MVRDVKIREIMVKPVISVHVDDAFEQVEAKLRGKSIRHLPVVDDSGAVVGLITQRDLFRTVSPHRNEEGFVYNPAMLHDFVLRHQMTRDPYTLTPEDPVSKALSVMIQSKYGCIPVTDEKKKLVGILTARDVLRWISSLIA